MQLFQSAEYNKTENRLYRIKVLIKHDGWPIPKLIKTAPLLFLKLITGSEKKC